MPQLSQGPNGFRDAETAYGGADAVPETPDASPTGADLEGDTARQRERGIMAMRQNIRGGRIALVLLSVVFTIGLAGWVFYFLYWPA